MNDERQTPQDKFDLLNGVFNFQLDPAATKENAKCHFFFTKEDNGLVQHWFREPVFVNPPYSRGQIILWIEKATRENIKTVMVLPGDNSTVWFHHLHDVAKIYFVKGRWTFGEDGPAKFGTILGLWNTTQEERVALAKVLPGWWA